jgi:hypothetical protein
MDIASSDQEGLKGTLHVRFPKKPPTRGIIPNVLFLPLGLAREKNRPVGIVIPDATSTNSLNIASP